MHYKSFNNPPQQAVKLLPLPYDLVHPVPFSFQAEPPHHPGGVQHPKETSPNPSSLRPEGLQKTVAHKCQEQSVPPLLPHPASILPQKLGAGTWHLAAVDVGEVKDGDVFTTLPLRERSGGKRGGVVTR